jgi:hypothetical protein
MTFNAVPPEIAPPEPNHIDDPRHWLDRAEEARAKADLMADPEARDAMLGVATQYERLAHWAQERATKQN